MDKAKRTVATQADELADMARKLRLAVLEMVYTAQSGHIGGSFSAAEIMAALYFKVLRIRPDEPDWPQRDRFVLSKGHTCPVLYACLAFRGFFPMETLMTLRRFESILQGHPIAKTPGVDVTTGSLGLGFGQAVGIALESKAGGRNYNVYALLGDGEIQEGVVYEAAQTASKYKLDNLIAIVDRNGIQNDGFVDAIMGVEPIESRFEAFGWNTKRINGHNMEEVLSALEQAGAHTGSPFCIVADTVKGKGVGFMENEQYWHGKPPTEEQYAAARNELLRGGGRDDG